MRKYSLLCIGFGLTVLLWTLNFIALTFSFYWTLGWYDYMMHFLGGLTIGILVAWFLGVEGRSLKLFLILFTTVMAAGAAYEIFEYIYDMTLSTEEYSIDTTHDLIMDAVGAITAYYLITLRSLKSF